MKDFLGSEYDVGDTIVYAAMSGRSVAMVLAKVAKFNESGTISVQPVGGSRWRKSASTVLRGSGYIDKRSGKGIEIYCASHKHHEVKPGYVHKETGERISRDEFAIKFPSLGFYGGSAARQKRQSETALWEYDYEGVLKDYVTEGYASTAKPVTVTLLITQNILKVDVPAEEEPVAV